MDCVPRLSPITKSLYNDIRKIFPKFIEDQPKYKDLERVKTYFEESDPVFSSKAGVVFSTNGSTLNRTVKKSGN
jgi:histidine ammonia-lyase